jgi:excisionase family DNA binding protein
MPANRHNRGGQIPSVPLENLRSMKRARKAETMSVEQAAALLGIGRQLAYQAVRDGEIPSIRIGKLIRVPRIRLELLLNGEAPASPPGPRKDVRGAARHGER